VCRIYLHFVLTLHCVCVYILNSMEQSVIERVMSTATISKIHINCKQISIETKLDYKHNIDLLQGCYAAYVGSWSQMFWESLLVLPSNVKQWPLLDFLTFENGTDRLSWSSGNQLPTYAITYWKSKSLNCMVAEVCNLIDFK
jgi:hypothetical protein